MTKKVEKPITTELLVKRLRRASKVFANAAIQAPLMAENARICWDAAARLEELSAELDDSPLRNKTDKFKMERVSHADGNSE